MTRIVGSVVIRRDPATVFDFVADQRNEPSYNPRMAMSEKVTDGPVGMGTRFHAVVESGGRPRSMEIETTGYDRPRHLASVTRMHGGIVTGSLNFEPVPDGTRMTWCWDVRTGGAVRLLSPLVKLFGTRQERRIWGSLKQHLEAQDIAPPAA